MHDIGVYDVICIICMAQQWLCHVGEAENPGVASRFGCFSNLNLGPKRWKMPCLQSVLEAQRGWF